MVTTTDLVNKILKVIKKYCKTIQLKEESTEVIYIKIFRIINSIRYLRKNAKSYKMFEVYSRVLRELKREFKAIFPDIRRQDKFNQAENFVKNLTVNEMRELISKIYMDTLEIDIENANEEQLRRICSFYYIKDVGNMEKDILIDIIFHCITLPEHINFIIKNQKI